MMDESGLCARKEYDEAYVARKNENQLKLGEVGMIYLEAINSKDVAIKYLARVKSFCSGVVDAAQTKVDIEVLDQDMQPVHQLPGVMSDGVWNSVCKHGDISAIVVKISANEELIAANGCLAEYTDGFGDELAALASLELAHAAAR